MHICARLMLKCLRQVRALGYTWDLFVMIYLCSLIWLCMPQSCLCSVLGRLRGVVSQTLSVLSCLVKMECFVTALWFPQHSTWFPATSLALFSLNRSGLMVDLQVPVFLIPLTWHHFLCTADSLAHISCISWVPKRQDLLLLWDNW